MQSLVRLEKKKFEVKKIHGPRIEIIKKQLMWNYLLEKLVWAEKSRLLSNSYVLKNLQCIY